MKDKIAEVYDNRKSVVWLLIIVVPLLILVVGSVVAQNIFWDSFLWRYFWAPVVADAEGEPVNGISAGYNIVNTITYGIILIVSFAGVFELIKHLDIKIDRKLIHSPFPWVILLSWVILGGSLRSLEDAGLFTSPLNKLMITPMIFFILGFFVIFLMLIGSYLSKIEWKAGRAKYMRLLILAPLPLIYLSLSTYLNPFFFSFLSILLVFLFLSFIIGLKYIDFDEKYLFFTYGTTLLSVSLSYNIYFILFKEGSNPMEAAIIPTLGVILTLLFLGFFWISDRVSFNGSKGESFEMFSRPLNVLICLAHLFDASATYRGIIVYGYVEKHVLPRFLIEYTFPSVIFILKVILVLVVVYVLDISLKEDFSEDYRLRSILKIVIIVLGASPAVRNTLRLAMRV